MSKLLDKIRKRTSLENRLAVTLQMEDYDNWENGEYFGNQERLVPVICKVVEQWQKDGASIYFSENELGDSNADD